MRCTNCLCTYCKGSGTLHSWSLGTALATCTLAARLYRKEYALGDEAFSLNEGYLPAASSKASMMKVGPLCSNNYVHN